jgi:hypothetical protein
VSPLTYRALAEGKRNEGTAPASQPLGLFGHRFSPVDALVHLPRHACFAVGAIHSISTSATLARGREPALPLLAANDMTAATARLAMFCSLPPPADLIEHLRTRKTILVAWSTAEMHCLSTRKRPGAQATEVR